MTEIQTTQAPTKLLRKLVEVRKAVPYLQKSQNGFQYKYVGSSDVLAAVREKLDEMGLVLFPKIVSREVTQSVATNTDKHGNTKNSITYFTELFFEFTWFDSESGESYVVPFYSQGVDTNGEKGVGKCLTYGEKYFMLKSFNIPTDNDDPDAFQKKSGQLSVDYISEAQVNELKGLLNQLASVCQVDFSSVMERFSHDFQVKSLEKLTTDYFGPAKRAVKDWLKKASTSTSVQQSVPQQAPAPQNPVQQQVQPASQMMQQPEFDQAKEVYKVLSLTPRVSGNGQNYMEMQVQTTTGQTLTVLARNESFATAQSLVIGTNYNLTLQEQNNMFFLV